MDARAAPQVDFDADKVRTLIAKYLGIDAEQVTDEVRFNDFDFDSLDRLELLILIEEELPGVEFSDIAVDQIDVVGDLIPDIETAKKAPGYRKWLTRWSDLSGIKSVAGFLGIDGMDNDERGRTELDEGMLTSDVPDDALERAAVVTDGQVVTVGHCTHWYHCGWPL